MQHVGQIHVRTSCWQRNYQCLAATWQIMELLSDIARRTDITIQL